MDRSVFKNAKGTRDVRHRDRHKKKKKKKKKKRGGRSLDLGVISSWRSRSAFWSFRLSSSSHCASGHRAADSARQKAHTSQQFGPVAAISVFLGGLNFGLFYIGLGLGSGKHVGDRVSTRHALYHSAGLAAARGEAISHNVRRSSDCIRRCGRAGGGAWLVSNALPLLLVVGAAFAFAMSNVLTKRFGPFDPLMLMGWSSLLTVPKVTVMSLLY